MRVANGDGPLPAFQERKHAWDRPTPRHDADELLLAPVGHPPLYAGGAQQATELPLRPLDPVLAGLLVLSLRNERENVK